MVKLNGQSLTRVEIMRRVGDIRQLASALPFELVDGSTRGTRGVRLYNGVLDLSVITDRGMAITELFWKGQQVSLLTPLGAVHPAYAEQPGLGWLRTWPAGFVTVCGLSQVGSPARDGAEELGQHGRAASLPASQVGYGGAWEGDDYLVWVEGTIREVAAFGLNLSLRRRVWTKLGEQRFWIEDVVTNEGFAPAPHMFLQHFNLGFPLLSASARLELPARATEPRDAEARAGLDACLEFRDPVPGLPEQVFYHDLQPDENGMLVVRLLNPAAFSGNGIGVYWKYRKADYPILVEWKNMAEGLYALGVEPSNCHVEGRVRERERGTLQVLEPQETRTYQIEVGFE